jgi:hypothetical protein
MGLDKPQAPWYNKYIEKKREVNKMEKLNRKEKEAVAKTCLFDAIEKAVLYVGTEKTKKLIEEIFKESEDM